MMYEEMYAVESEEISIKKYLKDQKEMINEMNSDEYTIGSKIKGEIMYAYPNLETQLKHAKALAKTYKNQYQKNTLYINYISRGFYF